MDFDPDEYLGDRLRARVNQTPVSRVWSAVVEFVDAVDDLQLNLDTDLDEFGELTLFSDDEYRRLRNARAAARDRIRGKERQRASETQ